MQFASESLECSRALRVSVALSSQTAGWTSLLVETHHVDPVDAEFETHVTPDQTIVVLLTGEQHIEVLAGGVWRQAAYQPGTVGLTPGLRTDRLRRRPSPLAPPLRKANIYLPHGLLDEVLDELGGPGGRGRQAGLNALAFRDALLSCVAQALVGAVAQGAADLYAASAARWLAVHLVCFHAGGLEPERLTLDAGAITDRRVARVLELMSSRLAAPLGLDELAAEAGVSKFHFVRLFREKVGATPHAYLVRLRLEAAKSMLAGSDLDIGTIAGRCGFGRGAELATAFGRRFGTTPQQWREAARRVRLRTRSG